MRIWVDSHPVGAGLGPGRLVEAGEPALSALDHGFTVGDGVFETVKVVGGVPFALTRHLDRLARSAAGLGLPAPDPERLRAAVAAVLAEPTTDRQRLRLTWTGGAGPLGTERGGAAPTLVVVAAELAPTPASAAVHVSRWVRNERGATAGLKTTSYAENVVALAEARAAGAGEAVLANTVGQLCEGTGSNIVLEVDGELVTPSLASGCLAGVTRALALQWCALTERDVPLEALRASREVLLASTTRDLQVVHAVDGVRVGEGSAGPLARAAQQAFATAAAQDGDP